MTRRMARFTSTVVDVIGKGGGNLNTGTNLAVNSGGSPDPGKLEYHMGPVLASPLKLYIICYGNWNQTHQNTIRDFPSSLSSPAIDPSVAEWWSTVRFYSDQTGSNVTDCITLSGEFFDSKLSHGPRLNRLSMQAVIKSAVTSQPKPLPLDPRNGFYLVLTSSG
ncbi:Protein EXORDIUM-like 7 [Hibiscus syriacus]|uniref:Protein EXORDIUM-like 7 n=1 Tax=Hibiscus syriacus TaxID=106335 RepID=A0A6A2ZC85_HIBSY|nr:Protein EXORDIUM-like 7 [Hibiscus syriacus]